MCIKHIKITQQLLKLPVKRRKAASWILDYSAYCPLSAWSPFRLHSCDRYPFLKYGRWTFLIRPIPARAVFLNQFSHRFSAGLSDKQLLQPSVDALELGSDRELQRSLSRWARHYTAWWIWVPFRHIEKDVRSRLHSRDLLLLLPSCWVHSMCFCSVRSKRNRRGPVIEADGMLKMFHCPYEGCSQVYVAISSFQVKQHSHFAFQLCLFYLKTTLTACLVHLPLSVESCQPRSQEREDQSLPPSRLWEKVLPVKPPASPYDYPFRWAHKGTLVMSESRRRQPPNVTESFYRCQRFHLWDVREILQAQESPGGSPADPHRRNTAPVSY